MQKYSEKEKQQTQIQFNNRKQTEKWLTFRLSIMKINIMD